jgi:hypothetical protein
MKTTSIIGSLLAILATFFTSAHCAEIFVANGEANTVGAYDATTGAPINASLVTGLNSPHAITVSDGSLFISNWGSGGSVGEYTTSGSPLAVPLLTSAPRHAGGQLVDEPGDMVISGNTMFVSNWGSSTIAEYTTAGAIVSLPFITISSPGEGAPYGIALSGNDLFVVNEGNFEQGGGSIGEYNASTGAVINANFITGLNQPEGITISGNDLFVVNNADDNNAAGPLTNGSVGEYDVSTGTAINAALVTGLNQPAAVAVLGNDLFVTSYPGGKSSGLVGEYDATTGATLNASFIAGLDDPQGIAVFTPEPSTWLMIAIGGGMLLAKAIRRRRLK